MSGTRLDRNDIHLLINIDELEKYINRYPAQRNEILQRLLTGSVFFNRIMKKYSDLDRLFYLFPDHCDSLFDIVIQNERYLTRALKSREAFAAVTRRFPTHRSLLVNFLLKNQNLFDFACTDYHSFTLMRESLPERTREIFALWYEKYFDCLINKCDLTELAEYLPDKMHITIVERIWSSDADFYTIMRNGRNVVYILRQFPHMAEQARERMYGCTITPEVSLNVARMSADEVLQCENFRNSLIMAAYVKEFIGTTTLMLQFVQQFPRQKQAVIRTLVDTCDTETLRDEICFLVVLHAYPQFINQTIAIFSANKFLLPVLITKLDQLCRSQHPLVKARQSILQQLIDQLIQHLLQNPDKLIEICLNMQLTNLSLLIGMAPGYLVPLTNLYIKHYYPGMKVLDPPPFVMWQHGPNCGHYALSAVTKYFCNIAANENSTCRFFPARKRDCIAQYPRNLRHIGLHTVKIPGIGGIYDLNLFLSLIHQTGLQGHIAPCHSVERFIELVCTAVDHQVPIILPYDKNDQNGDFAHYAVIVGYGYNDKQQIEVLFAQNAVYATMPADELYGRNARLKWTSERTYIKKKPGENYERLATETTTFYKSHRRSAFDLANMKNNLLIVYTQNQCQALRETALFKPEAVKSIPA